MSLSGFLERLRRRIQQHAHALAIRQRQRLRVTKLEDRRLLDASFGIELGGILTLGDFDAGDDLTLNGDTSSGHATFSLRSGIWDTAAPELSNGDFSLSADGRTLTLQTAVNELRVESEPARNLSSVMSGVDGLQVQKITIDGADAVDLSSPANDFDYVALTGTTVRLSDVDSVEIQTINVETASIASGGSITDAVDATISVNQSLQLSAESVVLGESDTDHLHTGELSFQASGQVTIHEDGDLKLAEDSSAADAELHAKGRLLSTAGAEISAGSVSLSAGDSIGSAADIVSVNADILHTDSGGDQHLGATAVSLGTLKTDATIHLESGTFVANDDASIHGDYLLESNAVLKGSGFVGDLHVTDGSIQPGNSPGILSSGDFVLGGGAGLLIEIQGTTPGTGHDQVDVTGTVTLSGGTLDIDVLAPYVPVTGDSFVIINNDGVDAVTGTFAGLAEGDTFTFDGEVFSVSYVGGDGNDVVVTSARHEFDFSSANFSNTESSGSISGTVERTGFTDVATSVDVVVGLATGTSAAETTDFTQETITLNFAAGETSRNFSITVANDSIVEENELIALSMTNFAASSGVGSTNATATATVTNDDTATLSISNVSLSETDADQNVNAVVTLDAEVEGGFSVAYASALGTAESTDVTVAGTSLSFAGTSGETQNVALTIVGDTIVEDTETFTITLGDVTGTSAIQDAAITTGDVSNGSITNDDTATLSISAINLAETNANQNVTATVSVDAAVEGGFDVAFTNAGVTAEASDFSVTGMSLSFAGNAAESHLISVTLVGDSIVEDNETFNITLGDVTGTSVIQDAAITTGAVSLNTIQNDDQAQLSIDDVSVDEAAGTATFTVSSSNPTEEAIGVSVALTQTSTSAADVTLTTPAATIAGDGTSTTASVTVSITDDRRVEGDETYSLAISSPTWNGGTDGSRAVISDAVGLGTVTDNETVDVSFSGPSTVVVEDTATTTVNVDLTITSSGTGAIGLDRTIEVDVDRTGGTANAVDPEADISYTDTTLSFGTADGDAAGFTKSVTVQTFEDILDDDAETLELSLQSLSDGTGGQASIGAVNTHTLTITDDDSATAVFDLVAGAGDVLITANGTNLEFYVGGVLQTSRAFADITTLVVQGTAADESLTLDFSNGVFTTDVSFDGAAGDDTVFIIGATTGSDIRVAYSGVDAEAGQVSVDGTVLNYSDIENNSLNITGASDLTLDFAGGDTGINFDRLNATQTQVTGNTFTTTNFDSPTDSLTLNFTDTANYTALINDLADDFNPVSGLTIAAAGASGNTDLTIDQLGGLSGRAVDIDLGGGTDSVIFQNTSQSLSSLSVVAETITATTSALSVSGITTLDAGASGDITFDNVGNDFGGSFVVTNARNIVVDDSNGLTFGSLNAANDLIVDAAGTVTFAGTAVVSGNLDVESGANGAAGAILDSTGQLNVTGTTTLDSGTNLITLDSAANSFGGDLSIVSAARAELVATSAVSLSTVNTLANFTITAASVDIVDTVTVGGALSLTANANSVTDSGGGNLQVGGVSTLSAAEDILLDAGSNNFGNQVSVTTARDVSLTDVNSLMLSTLNVTRDLTLNAAQVALLGSAAVGRDASIVASTTGILDSGAGGLNVTGDTSLQAAGDVTLDSSTNDFGGSVAVSSAVNVLLVDANSISLATSVVAQDFTVTATSVDVAATVTVGDELNLNATVGDVVDSTGQLAVTGTSTLQAAGDIVIDNAANLFGTINADAVNVTIVENALLDVGVIQATQMVVLTTTASIQDATANTVVDITANSVDLNAATGVGHVRALELATNALSADTTGGGVDLSNATASDADVSSLKTGNGDVTFRQNSGGNVSFSGPVSSGTPATGGDITLTSTAGLTIAPTSSVDSGTGSGGTLTVGGASILGQVAVGAGNVQITGGGPDLIVAADVSATSDIVLSADRDVIVSATVDANGGGAIVITADANLGGDTTAGGHGGVRLAASGLLDAEGDVTIQGADLFATATVVDAVVVDSDGTTVQLQSGGNVSINAGTNAPTAARTIINGRLATSSATGTIVVSAAGDVELGSDGDITSLQGSITITGDTSTGSPGGQIVMADGSQVSSTSGDIALTAGGDVLLGQLSTGGTVVVTSSQAAIQDNGDADRDIIASAVSLSALTGIGDEANSLETQSSGSVLQLAATTDSGDIAIDNLGALQITTVNGVAGISITDNSGVGADVQDSGGDNIALTAASPLTVNAAVANNDGGGISLVSTNDGGNDDHLTINANLSVTGGDAVVDATGNIVLNAGTDLVINADVSTDNGGTISATAERDIAVSTGTVSTVTGNQSYMATAGGVSMTDGTVFQSTSGTLDVAANTSISVASLSTNGRVRLTATTGEITDAGDTATDVVASELVASAATGIGSANALEAAVDTLAFTNSTSGDVGITNSQSLTIASLGSITASNNGGGNIEICLTTGNLNITSAMSAAGSTIRLDTAFGTISQSSAGILTAMALGTRATGSVSLATAANDVATFAAASTVAGDVFFNDTNGFTVGSVAAGNCFSATVGVATATGDVSLIANNGDLTNLDTVIAGGAGNVTLTTSLSGNLLLTGATSAAGDTVVINSAGDINGSGLVTANTVDLNASTGIGNNIALELAATVITADTTVGTIDVDNTNAAATSVNSLTSGGAGSITFDQAGGGGVDFATVTSTDGSVALQNAGAGLTVSGSVTAGGSGDVSLRTTGAGSVQLAGVVNAVGNTIDVMSADAVAGDAGNTAADAVASQLNITSISGIGSGAALETDVSILTFANTGSGSVQVTNATALTLNSGSNTVGSVELCVLAGDLVLNGLLTAGANTVRLQADNGSVSETVTGSVVAGQLGVRAADAISLSNVANNVGTFAAFSGTGSVLFNEADGFIVGTVTAGDCFAITTGVTTTGPGDVTLRAVTGNVEIADGVSSNSGNIDVTADNGSVTINSAVTSASGGIVLTGDSISQNDNVQTSAGGTIAITADAGDVAMADGSSTSAATGSVTLTASGGVALSSVASSSGQVSVSAGTSVTDITAAEAANISTTGLVTLDATAGIGTAGIGDIDTQIGSLQAVNSVSGDIVIQEANGLNVVGTGVATTGGNGNVSLHVLAGDLTTTAVVAANGSGNVVLDADAGAVENNAAVNSGAGNIQIVGNTIRQNANIGTTGAGAIVVDSDSSIVMADGTLSSTVNGGIQYTANGNVQVSRLNAGVSAVSVTATSGGISDNLTGEGVGSENIVGGDVTLLAFGDIGIPDDLDIDGATLDARSTNAGSINLAESSSLGTTFLQTANGAINLVAGGSVTGVTAESLTDADVNDISIRSDSGDVGVTSINAGSTGDVILQATTGSINDLAAGVNVVADNLNATAAGNIALDTTVAAVAATSTAAGSISLNESDAVVLTSVTTNNGSIVVTAGNSITASNVVAGGGPTDSVSLTATSGDLVATNVQAADSVALLSQTGNVTATAVTAVTGAVDIDATVGDVLVDMIAANGPVAPVTAVDIFAGNDIVDLNGDSINIAATSGRTILTAGRDIGFASTDVFKPTADDPLDVETAELQIQAGRNVAVRELSSGVLNLLTADVAFLTSAGDLNLAAGTVTTNSLSIVSGGTVTLPPAATPLSVTNDLRIEAADVAVTAGAIDINADRLLFKSGQAETLDLTVSQFDGETIGNLTINNDSAGMTLVDLDCDLTAIDVGANVATLNQTVAGLVSQRLPVTATENSRIIAGGLVLNGTGTFELTNTANDIDVLAGSNNGSIAFADIDDITVDTVGGAVGLASSNADILLQSGTSTQLNQQLNAGAAVIRLTANGGVSQSATGQIVVDDLAIRDTSNSEIRLAAGNDVNTLSIDNSAGGNVTFADTDDLTVGSVTGTTVANLSFNAASGITGDDIQLNAGTTTTLNEQLNANGGLNDIRITSGGDVQQSTSGVIVASRLGVRLEGAAGDVILDDANSITTLAIRNDAAGGQIAFRNTQALAIGAVPGATVDSATFTATNGVSSNEGDILIQADQSLQIDEQLDAGTASVRLNSADGVVQSNSGAIRASDLGIRNTTSGNILLGDAINDVDRLAIRNLPEFGEVRFFDSDDLTVGVVGADTIGLLSFQATTGIDTNAGDIGVTATDDLTVDENINAAHDTLTTDIDESVTLIARDGDFQLADNRSISTDEDPTPGIFSDFTGDEVTIIAGSGGVNGVVRIGDNSEVRTDGGVARQIAPRPTAFAAAPTIGAQNAFVTLTDAENSRSNLSFVSGGFLGELELVFGVAGEENLEVVVDWGVVSQTDFNTGPAGNASQTAPGEFAFGLDDADKAVYFIDEGGATYQIPHLYAPADLLTTSNDRNGREINPNIIGVRFSVAQHESINIWGANATDPVGTPDTAPPTFTGASPTIVDASGMAIQPGTNLALLSSTDTNGLDEFNQEAAQLPLGNLSNTPTGQPEGFAEWEFLAGPSPGVIPATRFAEQQFDLPLVESPEISQIVSNVFGDVSLDSGAAGESAIGTEVYLQIRRHFELDAEAEVVIQRIADNSFISSREAFEEFVEDNPVLQDGDGYEVWLITETGGQKVARPIVEFEITGGRPGPATEDLPELFEPYRLEELEFEQPEQPQPEQPAMESDGSAALDVPLNGQVDVDVATTGETDDSFNKPESPLADSASSGSQVEHDRDTGQDVDEESTLQDNGFSESMLEGVSASAIGLTLASGWRRRQSRTDDRLSTAALLSRRLRRSAESSLQESERTSDTDSQNG